ncbi:hypothetical protein GTR00_16780 [Kineococcus sp. T90]|nr:hypothetical protein [Kineococcus indalonis]
MPGVAAAGPAGPGVLCAPTPTDEELPWPAVLVATLPLGPDRRRVVPGPAAGAVLDAAAGAYGELLVQVAADGGDALALLPHGVPAGRLDAAAAGAVRAAVEDSRAEGARGGEEQQHRG